MKLSILIPTHNRPKLFRRCLESVLKQLPENVEVIVNNDSYDIKEIKHKQVKYFYYKSSNLADIYKFLLDKSKGDFCYFLEDDDYLLDNFFSKIKYKNSIYAFIPHSGIKNYFKIKDLFKDRLTIKTYNKILEELKEPFQFSQIIFSSKFKNLLPNDNNIHNDFLFFKKMLEYEDFEIINKPIFQQTCDAGDNISFPDLNKDLRFE